MWRRGKPAEVVVPFFNKESVPITDVRVTPVQGMPSTNEYPFEIDKTNIFENTGGPH